MTWLVQSLRRRKIGHRKLTGGNVVVLYASVHHDILIVVKVSGRYKMDRGIEERLGKDYIERAKKDGFIDIKSKTVHCKACNLLKARESENFSTLSSLKRMYKLYRHKDMRLNVSVTVTANISGGRMNLFRAFASSHTQFGLWHQTFGFPDDGSLLALHVKDHNALLPTSSIGDCIVLYQRLPPNEMSDKWIPLQRDKNGEIHVQVSRKVPQLQKNVSESESLKLYAAWARALEGYIMVSSLLSLWSYYIAGRRGLDLAGLPGTNKKQSHNELEPTFRKPFSLIATKEASKTNNVENQTPQKHIIPTLLPFTPYIASAPMQRAMTTAIKEMAPEEVIEYSF
ncbi:putative reverse transcriptase domain-containing protein [Tanacetum coccineum]